MKNKDRVVKELGLRKFGVKGWMSSKECSCESCGRHDKAGVLFTEKGGVWHCMRCDIKIHIYKFLRKIDKGYLIEDGYEVSVKNQIKLIGGEKVLEEDTLLPIKRLPVGFKKIENDEYLDGRGFLPYHYELFKPGKTRIDLSLSHSIIFQIFDVNNRRVAWLGRSRYSKDWHEENLKKFKQGLEKLCLRYNNSPSTDFSYILGGESEITENTKEIILVEGLFDKVNVDRQLRLYESDLVKCLFTFGDRVKAQQILKLKQFKNVNKYYLLYDYGTINNSKSCGLSLVSELQKEVGVCEIKSEDCDPGDLSQDELISVLKESVDPLVYKFSKLSYVI